MASITDRAMRAQPQTKDTWLIDPAARGEGRLVGRITPAGTRCFYYRYTAADGSRVRLLLGAFDPHGDGAAGFTVQQARDRCRELTALHRSGIKNLREHFEQQQRDREQAEADARRAAEIARQRAEEEARERAAAAARRVTVRTLFEQWQRVELAPHTLADGTRTGRKDGGEWVRQSFERRLFPKLGDVAAEDVRKPDLLAILDETKAAGQRRTANVLLADMRQMFRFAAEREIVARNPLEGIKRASVGGKDVERDRVLDEAEIKVLWAAVPAASMSKRSAAAIWLILATACRVGEAMAARWENVDLEKATWYLPETKNERDHTIHLSALALRQFKVLYGLREVTKDADGKDAPMPWVFPATDPTTHVCIKSFGKQLADRQRAADKRMKNRTKNTASLILTGGRWTAHDLRRTAATLMAKAGISTDVIDECLNHKLQSKVARVYIKDRRLPEQARAFDALGRRLEAITTGVVGTVVELRAA
jgi:integrase